ncbi:4Fe-4S binding protein [Cellulomonas cellasea]|uniref:ATP-binding protein n=1 Tax=Cellulomonas cellasea TaxID=43670 RepID=UPI0025A480A5|nr:4Fe-4S dicluster domain-containing protein [Cellulomonas cellasea]MDM8083527.1 4Fe-4S binding protein [Cellulomonas cellasea]
MTSGPLHALQVWLRHEPEEPDLELVCAEHPDPSRGDRARTVVRLTVCASQLPWHELAELLLVGARTVTVRLDGCADPDASAQNVEAVARVLHAAGVDRLRVEGGEPAADAPGQADKKGRGLRGRRVHRPRPVLDGAHLPVPRRRLLGLGVDVSRALPDMHAAPQVRLTAAVRALAAPGVAVAASADPAATATAATTPISTAPTSTAPTSTASAGAAPGPAAPGPAAPGVAAPAEAPTPAQAPRDGLDDVNSPAVVLSAPGCTACGVCVQACPTQALTLQHNGGGAVAISTLLQSPSACDGCQRCVELCPADVLSVAGQWRWSDLLTDSTRGVATVSTATCTRCGTQFPTTSGERWCQVCSYRRKNPFGSALPPGVAVPTR